MKGIYYFVHLDVLTMFSELPAVANSDKSLPFVIVEAGGQFSKACHNRLLCTHSSPDQDVYLILKDTNALLLLEVAHAGCTDYIHYKKATPMTLKCSL